MRQIMQPWLERSRLLDGPLASDPNSGFQGMFIVPGPEGMTLRIMASDGRDWDEAGLPEPRWEHVSVSLERRTPTWREMEFVREAFFADDETVLQFSVPREQHLNCHPHCLHMWRPVGIKVPLPPPVTVAFPKEATR